LAELSLREIQAVTKATLLDEEPSLANKIKTAQRSQKDSENSRGSAGRAETGTC
jgi:2-oxo-4-hydroxy-4-carboxy--5-ureidoimidazoline (OHCU) decarboxylase